MVQRNKALEIIEKDFVPVLTSLVRDARGSGQESPYKVQVYSGGNGDSGREIAEFTVETTPSNGDLKWDRNILQRMVALAGNEGGEQEISIHVHGTTPKPLEGSVTFNFTEGATGERAAEA